MKIIKNPCQKVHGGKEQVQQCNQNKGGGPGLVGYTIQKLDTKLAA